MAEVWKLTDDERVNTSSRYTHLSIPVSHAGRRKPQLILLDHGLYKNLDFATRTNYAALWKVHSSLIPKVFS